MLFRSSNGATTASISVNSSGVYWVNVKNTSSCSAVSKSIQITVLPTPYVTIYGSNTNLCKGTVVLQAYSPSNTQNISYLWSNGATSQSIVVSSQGTYTVTVKNAYGCSYISSGIIVSGAGSSTNLPVITYSGSLKFCSGDSVILKASSGFSNYLWSTNETSSSIIVKKSGTYTVSTKDSSGCILTSSSVVISVEQKPMVQILSKGNLCSGIDTLTAYVSPASNTYTYQWSNGATTKTIFVTTAGTYTVTVGSSNACSAVSLPFVVKPGSQTQVPVIKSSGSLKFCSGDSIVLSTTTSYANYQWSNQSTTSSIVVKKSGTYYVYVKDINGCSGYASVVVSVEQKPIVQILSKGNLCSGIDTLTAYVSPASNTYTYQWSNGATSQTIFVTTAGTYSVTVSSSNGCSTVSSPFVVKPGSQLQTPVISANGPIKFCSGDSIILSTTIAYTNYQWSTGATSSKIVVKQSGTYYVNVKDINGCSAYSKGVIVNVEQTPIVQIYSKGNICVGADTLYAYASPSNSNYSYNWSNGSSAQMILVSNPGTYSVTATSSNGCVSNVASTTVQGGALPTPLITYNGSL